MPSSNSDARKRHDELTMRWAAAKEAETTLLGLSGWAQSGKDSTAKVFVEDYGFTPLGFADGLREVMHLLNPLFEVAPFDTQEWNHYVDTHGYEAAKQFLGQEDHAMWSGRALLQRLGTAVRDVIGEDAWVEAAMRKVEPGGKYVFTDVRFPNEFRAIKNRGGQVWRIVRANHAPANDHISETGLDNFDFDRRISLPDFGDDLDALNVALRRIVQVSL